MQWYPFVPIKKAYLSLQSHTHKKTKQNEKKKIKSYTFTWRNQTLFWFSHHMIKSHPALVLHAFFPWIWLHNPHLTTHKLTFPLYFYLFLFFHTLRISSLADSKPSQFQSTLLPPFSRPLHYPPAQPVTHSQYLPPTNPSSYLS